MPILKLVAQLGVDGRGFRAGLKEAEVVSNRFAGNLKAQLAAAFGVAAGAAYLKHLADTVGRIKDLADQYSITTDEVQRADVALKQNGLQFENLGQSLQKLGSARREAVRENGDLRATFAKYGVTLKDLDNPQLRTYVILLKIADALKKTGVSTQDQIILSDLLGQRSLRLVTTLAELHKYDTLKIIEPHEIELIDQANKKLEELKRRRDVLFAAGIVEGSRDPIRTISDYMRSMPVGAAPVPTMLSILGHLWEKASQKAEAATPTPPVTQEEIQQGKKERDKRIEQQKQTSGLFPPDAGKGKSLIDFLSRAPGGFAAMGGRSGGTLTAPTFDPLLFIVRDQLTELRQVNTNLSDIKTRLGGGTNSGASPFSP